MDTVPTIALAVACLLAGHHVPITIAKLKLRRSNARYMLDLVARSVAPRGYGAIITPRGKAKPEWLDDQELVVRHLPGGPSERKAMGVTTWCHPFRLRADHPHYAMA